MLTSRLTTLFSRLTRSFCLASRNETGVFYSASQQPRHEDSARHRPPQSLGFQEMCDVNERYRKTIESLRMRDYQKYFLSYSEQINFEIKYDIMTRRKKLAREELERHRVQS